MSEIQKVGANVPWYNDEKQVNLLKRTFAKDTTTDEFFLFVGIAKRTGLDPFTKQIHCVVRGSGNYRTMSVQCGIDGYRAIAERSKSLAGIDDPVYDTEAEKHPNKATVTVYRFLNGQRVPFTASARWDEYKQEFKDKKTGEWKLGNMWKKMPYLMLGKCAEALALRKAFPNDLSDLYTNEEMAHADTHSEEPRVVSAKVEDVKSEVKEMVINGKKKEAEALMEATDHTPTQPKQEEKIIDAEVVPEATEVTVEEIDEAITPDEAADMLAKKQ